MPRRNSPWPVEVIAHRGASALAPENTLGAVQLAWKLDADAVEVDVNLSADRRLIVIHDETLARTAGRSDRVDSLTAAELAQVDVGSWFGSEWSSERVLPLREFIASVPDDRRIFVELKCGEEEDTVEALAEALADVSTNPSRVVLIGFDLALMRQAKQSFAQHSCYLVARQDETPDGWTPTAQELSAAAVAAGLDGVDLSNTLAVDRSAVKSIHDAGLACCIWTVKNIQDAVRLIEAGVDSLTMDDPRLLDSLEA